MPSRVEVCPVEEFPPGERRIVEVEGLPHSVGVFNVGGEFYALANVCPHHLAPLCEGKITGEVTSSEVGEFEFDREGEVIQCPWHGWEFNIEDGTSVFNPHQLKTRTYEAAVEHGSDADGREAEVQEYGTALKGEEPPIETYEVAVDRDVVVVYV